MYQNEKVMELNLNNTNEVFEEVKVASRGGAKHEYRTLVLKVNRANMDDANVAFVVKQASMSNHIRIDYVTKAISGNVAQ